MKDKGEQTERLTNADADHIANLLEHADRILIKKLSNNDRDWAKNHNKHQGGVYIPHEFRDGGFFKALGVKDRGIDGGDKIYEGFFRTIWPQLGRIERRTRLVNYTSKGEETHMTRIPKEGFSALLPASYLVMGRFRSGEEFIYECLTIDSTSDEADFLRDIFDLESDFLIGEFDPGGIKSSEKDRFFDFVEHVIESWLAGEIALFSQKNAAMPPTADLARMALNQYLHFQGLSAINPFDLDAPGDVLRFISRSIEWNLFREFQMRERSVELIRKLIGDKPRHLDEKDIIRMLIDKFQEIDAIMLSASQQRKSRAGYSYEHHIEAILIGGNIPFQKQVIIESKKRPDFILPSSKFINAKHEVSSTGLILSAKTTLRERWKQVQIEKKDRQLFLTTVDENIASNAIEDMASIGIYLVVPEALMNSNVTEYSNHQNVMSFKTFCEKQIKPHLDTWRSFNFKK
jgi:hypothetical protein